MLPVIGRVSTLQKGTAVDTSLHDKVAVVTGSARGIGRAVALRLAARGADVAVTDLDLSGGSEFSEAVGAGGVRGEIAVLGRRAFGLEGDLVDREFVDRFFSGVLTNLGGVDILVNCAGGAVSAFEDSAASTSSDEDMAKVLGANFTSAVHCSQAAVARMRARGGGGCIVNISSVAASGDRRTDGRLAYYASSKAALVSYARSLAGEVGRDGIRVNTVACGVVLTPRIAASADRLGIGTPEQLASTPLGRFGTPADVADVVELLVSDLAGYLTGQVLTVNGGAAG